MTEISAATVMKLRKISGQGMMDCKKALEESSGDMDKAMESLRKKGLATLSKRADRQTSEGRLLCAVSPDGRTVAMVSLCCETDFVAKNDDFIAASEKLAQCAIAAPQDHGTETLMNVCVDGRPFADILTDTVAKTGEKTEIGDFFRFTLEDAGVIGYYVHFNNKVGAMVQIETSSQDVAKAIKPLANGLAMHITAINPVALDRQSVDPAIVQKEREIAAEQVKDKPAAIVEKIVDGKMAKFFKDNCLVDQPFVRDDSKTVAQALAEAAKEAGGQAEIKRFIRVEIG